MWFSFAASVLACAIVLYVPGFFALKALKMPFLLSLACAPLVSVPLYCVMGIAYAACGVGSSFTSVVAVSGVVLAVVMLIAVGFRQARHKDQASEALAQWDGARNWGVALLYIAVGVLVGTYVMVMSLDGPDSVIQTYDNVFHYNLMRAFADSGEWSLLSCSVYPADGNISAAVSQFGYYPAGWHVVGAAIISCLGVSVGVASNALNFVLIAVVFPLALCALMLALFQKKRFPVVVLGAFCCVAVAAFPWVLMLYWPLYPNSASLAILPAILACFIELFSGRLARDRMLPLAATVLFGIVSLGCVQPNSVFSAVVFLVPFCMYALGAYGMRSSAEGRGHLRGVLASVLFGVFVLVVWAVLFNLPFFQGVVTYYWAPVASLGQAFLDAASMKFMGFSAQPIVAVLVVIGIVCTVVSARDVAWLSASYVLACVIFIVAAAMGDTFIKHFVAGFWYTDPYRVAAFAGVFAVPLVALGLYALVCAVGKAAMPLGERPRQAVVGGVSGVLVLAFVALAYFPATLFGRESADTSFDELKQVSEAQNSIEAANPYDHAEAEFVQEVKDVTPRDAVIINQPYDGSMLAYGLSDLNEYYRDISGYGGAGETGNSVTIREGLSRISTDEAVRKACAEEGASYVMVLEQNEEDQKTGAFPTYQPDQWVGINSITDSTPGFEIVLAKDDMRLYRITAVD